MRERVQRRRAAVFEFHLGGQGIAVLHHAPMAFDRGEDPVGLSEQADRQVHQVDQRRRQTAGRAFIGLQAPVGVVEHSENIVAEIRLDMHQRAELAVARQRHCVHDGRFEPAFVADGHLHAGLFDGFHRPQGGRAVQAERFFAKDVFARAGGRDDLFFVQRMRRCQDHGVDIVVRQYGRIIGRKFDSAFCRECGAGVGIHVQKLYDRYLVAGGQRLSQNLSPPAEADNRSVEHVLVPCIRFFEFSIRRSGAAPT